MSVSSCAATAADMPVPIAIPSGIALIVSVIYWIMQGIVLALLLDAMKLDLSFTLVLGITSLPILVGMLSPIPGGAVVREALMYVVARLAGVSGSEVVAAAVIYRFALFGAIPILYGLTRLWITMRGTPSEPTLASETN